MRCNSFGGIGLLGGSSGICTPSSTCISIVVIIGKVLIVKKYVGEGSLAIIDLSVIDWVAFSVGGLFRFCNFALPLGWVGGRAIQLGSRAGVAYSDIVDSQRLTSAMVIGLPAAYIEFQVAMGVPTVP